MGKKFKSPKKHSPSDGQQSGNDNAGHMGVSDRSKKIKKQKKDNLSNIREGAIESKAIIKSNNNKAQKKMKTKTPVVDEPSKDNLPDVVLLKTNQNGLKRSEQKKDEQETLKKGQKTKPSVDKQAVTIDEADSNAELKKAKKNKRKASALDTDLKDGTKKDNLGEINETETMPSKDLDVLVSNTVLHGKKQHKKKNKKKHINGAETNYEISVRQSKVKAIEADNHVVTSESDSESEQKDSTGEINSKLNSEKAKDNNTDEPNKEKRFTGPEHSIFIGNLPNTVKKSTMKALFKQYGEILSIRFRSNDGVVLFKKKDRKEAKALNCYIRFEKKNEAEAACAANGQLVEGNRIRVTNHTQKQMGHVASTVFVGNINHKTTDNELYDFFSCVGDIEYVRQISDKGIGYVCFKKGVSIAKALKLNQQLLNGRPLRIMKADPNKQNQRKNKKGNLVDKAKFPSKAGPIRQSADKDNRQHAYQKPDQFAREYHGSVAKNKPDNRHRQKKKGGSDKKKKLLAQKLKAAGTSRK